MSGFSDSGSAGFSDSGSAGIDDESSAGTTYFGDGGRMSSIADSAWTVDQGFNIRLCTVKLASI